MTALIQSAATTLALAFREAGTSIELPSFTLHKMCYGYLINDWVMIVTSVWTLVITLASVVGNVNR
jgi:hypothetical protein